MNPNYELKHPNKDRTHKILISEDDTVEELSGQFGREFKAVHGYDPVWAPKPITKEWLIDQLQALDWYLPIPVDYVAEEPLVKTRKKKDKETNPFK